MWKFFVGSLLLALTGATSAQPCSFAFSGDGTHLYNAYECPDTICTTTGYDFGWAGTVALITSSAVDGVYSGADVIRLAVTSPIDGFSTDGFETGSFYGSSPSSAVTVTIAGGEVTAISADFWTSQYSEIRLAGLDINLRQGLDVVGTQAHHAGLTFAGAVLTPLIPVPEPSNWSLVMVGLLVVGAYRRKAKSAAAAALVDHCEGHRPRKPSL